MSERQPVPESEWPKFHEDEVEAARRKILDAGERKQAEFFQEEYSSNSVAQNLRNEELLNGVEAGELTYEQLDQQVLQTYREMPATEHN